MPPNETATNKPTITLHMVSSLDGFVARNDNTVSWLEDYPDVYEAGIAEDGGDATVTAIECYVLGSRTYEHALELGWPYGDTPTIVITSRELPSTRKSVEFYCGDINELVNTVLAPRYRNIWLVGGAALCEQFLQRDLIDEIRMMIAPVTLGDGLRLFGNSGTERRWRLKNSVAYKNGFVALHYVRLSTKT